MKKFIALLALLLALSVTCAMAQTTYLPVSGYSVTTPDNGGWDLYPGDSEDNDWLGAFPGEGSDEYYAYIGVYPDWGYDENIDDSRLLDIVTNWVDGDEPHDAWLTTYNGMRFGVGHRGSQDSEANEIMYFCFRDGNLILIGSDEYTHVPTDAEAEAAVRQIVDGLSVLNGNAPAAPATAAVSGDYNNFYLNNDVVLSLPTAWGIDEATSENFVGGWLEAEVTNAGTCYFCFYTGDSSGDDYSVMGDNGLISKAESWGSISERFTLLDTRLVTVGDVHYAMIHCLPTDQAESYDSEKWELVTWIDGKFIDIEIDNDSGVLNSSAARDLMTRVAELVSTNGVAVVGGGSAVVVDNSNGYVLHDSNYDGGLTLVFNQPSEDWDIYGVDEPGPYQHVGCYPDVDGGELYVSVFVAGGWDQYDYSTMTVDQLLERGESWGSLDEDYISTEYVTYKGVPFAAIHYEIDNRWEYMTFANGIRVVFTGKGYSVTPSDDQAQEYIRRTIDATDLIGGGSAAAEPVPTEGPAIVVEPDPTEMPPVEFAPTPEPVIEVAPTEAPSTNEGSNGRISKFKSTH